VKFSRRGGKGGGHLESVKAVGLRATRGKILVFGLGACPDGDKDKVVKPIKGEGKPVC